MRRAIVLGLVLAVGMLSAVAAAVSGACSAAPPSCRVACAVVITAFLAGVLKTGAPACHECENRRPTLPSACPDNLPDVR